MSVWPHGVTEQWFMVLYLLIGQWAHGNEWALRRAWPPTLILQNWATQKCTVTLLTQKKTSTLSRFVELALEICRFLQSNYTIPLRHNVVLEQQMRRQNYPERWITGGGCIWFNWDYKRFLFYNKAEEKVIKIQTGVEGASPENVWLGTELLQQPKKMLLMVYVTDDWYHHHYTPKLLLMEQLSWKKCRLPDFFKPHHHHSEIDEKAQARLWHLWDGSVSRGFPPHLNKARINFEDPPRDFRGAAEEVSISTKVWISCIVPNPPSQLLSVLQFCLCNVSVKHAIPWYIFDCVVL